MNTTNFNPELGKLLVFISNVATAIRMNSAYDSAYQEKNPAYSDDVMWLSDSLHTLFLLGNALQEGDLKNIECACEDLIKQYNVYSQNDTGYKTEPSPTFAKQRLFSLEDGIGIFQDIINKAKALEVKN